MKVYNKRFLKKLQSRAHTLATHFVPFKGKYPTRLYVKISVTNPKTGDRVSRFCYNGVYCPSVIRYISRLAHKMASGDRERLPIVDIFEYHQKGIIYAGSLWNGTTYQGHHKAHFHSFHNNLDQRRASHTELVPETSVKCGSFYMLVPENLIPQTDDKLIWSDFKREMRERYIVNEVR